MTLAWAGLSHDQRLVLEMLDDGFPYVDSVGKELDRIDPELHTTVGLLKDLDLVDIDLGWNNRVWIRLTPKGRLIRDTKPVS